MHHLAGETLTPGIRLEVTLSNATHVNAFAEQAHQPLQRSPTVEQSTSTTPQRLSASQDLIKQMRDALEQAQATLPRRSAANLLLSDTTGRHQRVCLYSCESFVFIYDFVCYI